MGHGRRCAGSCGGLSALSFLILIDRNMSWFRRKKPDSDDDGDDDDLPPRNAPAPGKLAYGIKLNWPRSLTDLEDWLDENCSGDCQVKVSGMSEDLRSKAIVVSFQYEDDRTLFKANVRKI